MSPAKRASLVLSCLSVLWGCTTPKDGSPPAVSSVPATVRPDERAPEPIVVPVVEKICKAADCSGTGSRIWVLRKDNRIERYLHHGDIRRCSHPPSTYFDRDGKEVGAMPMRPVRDPEDAKQLDEQRNR